MNHADTVIEAVAIDRQTGMVLCLEADNQVINAGFSIDGHDISAGYHHVDNREIAQIQHIVQEQPLHWLNRRLILIKILDQFLKGIAHRRFAGAATPQCPPDPFPRRSPTVRAIGS